LLALIGTAARTTQRIIPIGKIAKITLQIIQNSRKGKKIMPETKNNSFAKNPNNPPIEPMLYSALNQGFPVIIFDMHPTASATHSTIIEQNPPQS
jgi:hypothetical protein